MVAHASRQGIEPGSLPSYLQRYSMSWSRLGKTCEATGSTLTKTSGGSYPRHASFGPLLTEGVHTWELVLTAAATANGNRTAYVGVGREGLDVEKGNHAKSGDAWYLRIDNGTLYGSGVADVADQAPVAKAFVVGDRIGVRLDLGDGSLAFEKNGSLMVGAFPAGSVSDPVVGAVELLTVGQALTLKG